MRLYNLPFTQKIRQELRGNMTKAEAILWKRIKGRQVRGIKFRRQYGVGPYVVDFYFPKRRLAIEVDGDSHLGEEAEKYDKERQKYIEDCGISFLRFTNEEIYKNLNTVIQKIHLTISPSGEGEHLGGAGEGVPNPQTTQVRGSISAKPERGSQTLK